MVEIKSSKYSILAGSAAAIAVFLSILYIGMFNTGRYSPDVITGVNETEYVLMPDSSQIFLQSNSTVKYHCNKLTGKRSVVLSGEAFFEVNGGRKFQVDFNGGYISVTGTKFYVVAHSDQYVNVDCLEGSLEFSFGRYKVDLEAGQGIKVFKDMITGPYSIDAAMAGERMDGVYFWDKASVEEIFHLIGYRYKLEIELDRHAGKRNFTGKINMTDLENSLNIISFAMDLDYIIDNENQTIHVNAK